VFYQHENRYYIKRAKLSYRRYRGTGAEVKATEDIDVALGSSSAIF
jgi:hypothetical protein